MNKIQRTIRELQKNFSELQYDLHLKENQPPNIYDSIECEMLWKRNEIQTSTTVDTIEDDDEDDLHDCSTPSPTTCEHSLLSFLVGNDSSIKDEKLISSDTKQTLPIKKSTTILTTNNKKRRICMNCGKC